MKIRNLAAAFAGLVLLAFTSFAQITAIEGTVKGADGKPVQAAVIKIVRTDIKGNYQVKTDKKGHYIYNGLPMGVYNVSCEVDGKQVDIVNNQRTHPGDPTPVNFDLKAVQDRNAATQKALDNGQTKDVERGMSAEQKKALEETMKKREETIRKNAALNEAYSAGKTALECSADENCLKTALTQANTPQSPESIKAEKERQLQKAIENLSKATEIDPTQIAVWTGLASAYQGLAETKTGPDFDANMQKCLEAYTKAIAIKPEDAGLHNNYALALAKAKKFADAQAELAKAADLDPPGAGKYFYNLGALETNAGQAEPASEAFKKAIAANPPYPDAYYQYGLYLMGKASIAADGKVTPVPGTAETFQKYLEIAPTGQFAQAAKDMLAALGSSVEVQYKNPDAGKKKKK
jgi:Tfp pilus assembly protein PilF